jgi:TolA-binding protein
MRRSTSWGWVIALFLVPALAAQRADEDFQLGLGLVQRGLHAEAAQAFERFVRAQPDHERTAEALYRLGHCRSETGQRGPAIAAWQRALERDRGFALRGECRYRLGHALREDGQLEPALAAFEALLADAPRDHYLLVPAQYAAGECARDLGRKERALELFTAAAASDQPEYGLPGDYQAGFLLLALERPADAAASFGRAADRFPQHAAALECRYLQGDAAFRARDFAAAQAAFAPVRAAGGEFADDAALGLAWCAVEAGDAEAALRAFRAVVAMDANGPLAGRAQLEAGRLLHRAGRHDAAVEELAPLLGDGAPSGAQRALVCEALEIAGLSLLHASQPAPARAHLQRALTLEPSAAAAARLAYGIGEASAQQGEWQAALAAYRECLAKAPDPELAGDARYGECLTLHKLEQLEASLEVARAFGREHAGHRLAAHARFAVAENLFALARYAEADTAYEQVPAAGELAPRAAFKRAWCAYLQGERALAAQRFGALVPAEPSDQPLVEEALSMEALALFESGAGERALAAADRYRARHPQGQFLARTERVASRVLRARGELAAAAERLAHAAKSAATPQEAGEDRLEQADLVFRSGDFEAAAKTYTALAERADAVGARARAGLAWCAFELGDDPRCLRESKTALAHPQADAERAGMLELQIAVHQRAARWDEAAAVAREFLAGRGEHARAPHVRFALGLAQARGGDDAQARATLEQLVAGGGFDRMDRAWYELAWACRRQGDEPAALAAFAKVADASQDADLAGEARLHLGTALLADDVAKARELLAQVGGQHRARALYRLGFSWFEKNEHARALQPFDEMLALAAAGTLTDGTLIGEARFFAGECRLALGEHALAAEHYRALLAAAADHERAPAARLHLGRCALELGRPEEAIDVLAQHLAGAEQAPAADRARAHLWLGQARLAAGQHERAEQELVAATRLSEGEVAAQAQFCIGEARRARDDLEGAVDAYVKLSVLYAHEQWVQRGLLEAARCYEKLEQIDKAQRFFAELVERFPDAPATKEAREALQRLRGN